MRKPMRLFRDRRGTAAVEFALVSLFLFGVLMVALDFAFYTQQKLKLGNVVEQAAILAYDQQVTSDTSGIKSYIETYSGLKTTPTATITCNGTSSCGDGKCSCITSGGAFTVVNCLTTGNPTGCASAAIAGNYLKISASAVYNSVIVPNKYLGGGTITQTAVVRLQ